MPFGSSVTIAVKTLSLTLSWESHSRDLKKEILTRLEAAELSSPEFIFDEKNDFEKIVFDDGFVIVTDILPKKNGKVELEKSLQKIYSFTKTILGPLKNYKLLVLRKDYAKNPLVGISEAFSFLKRLVYIKILYLYTI